MGSELDRILESPQNTALHVINGTVQASQSTVALRAAKQGGCGGSEVQKKTRQTLLTEALTQLCGEGRRMLKLRKKSMQSVLEMQEQNILKSNGKIQFQCACVKPPLMTQ